MTNMCCNKCLYLLQHPLSFYTLAIATVLQTTLTCNSCHQPPLKNQKPNLCFATSVKATLLHPSFSYLF